LSLIPLRQPSPRAALARIVEGARRERDALATLEAGRDKLTARIADAEREVEEESAADDREAEGIVAAIRKGADFALSFVRPARGPRLDLTVARRALAKADAALAAKEAEIEALAGRVPAAVDTVLKDEARIYADAYDAALTAAVEAAARLEALDIYLGGGRLDRLMISAPGFSVVGDLIDTRPVAASKAEIGAASGVWRAFASALAADPQAEAAKHLKFAPHDPGKSDPQTYESMTMPERRLVDVRHAQG
jgi:hypothetical protein